MTDRHARSLRARAYLAELRNPSPAAVFILGELTRSQESIIRAQIDLAVSRSRPGISLRINSPGGLIAVADRICYDLAQAGLPVSAHAFGQCSSAAIGPLLAASTRSASHSTEFFLHPARVEAGELTARELRARASDLEWDDRRYRTMLGAAGLPNHIIQASCRKAGITLQARDAYAFGLVHRLTGK